MGRLHAKTEEADKPTLLQSIDTIKGSSGALPCASVQREGEGGRRLEEVRKPSGPRWLHRRTGNLVMADGRFDEGGMQDAEEGQKGRNNI